MKVWIKAYNDDKILHSIIIKRENALSQKLFNEIISEACYLFDYSTPIILSSHYNHFVNFNLTKFTPNDFIEKVDFTKLTVENCKE